MTRQTINNGEDGLVVRNKINGNTDELYRAALGASRLRLKPVGEPIFVLFTGQSNALGQNVALTYDTTINPEVFDWNAPTGSSSYTWNVSDPSRGWVPPVGGTAAVGMRGAIGGNPAGSPAWAMANMLQKATGRRVYVLSVTEYGANASKWQPAGTCNVELAAQIGPAMAAAGVTKVDILVWLQGESDKTAGAPAFSYADTVKTILTTHAWAGGWSTPNYTHNIIVNIGDDWGPWSAHWQLAQLLAPHSSFVSTQGREEDGVHFLGDASCFIGEDCAQAALVGPVSVAQRKDHVYQAFLSGSSVGTAAFTIEAGFIGNGQLLIYARNADNSKFLSATVMYWYQYTGRLGTAVLATAGESGFTYTVGDFIGLFGSLNIAGTAGETWYWTVCQTKAPSVTAP
jgi:hypothetical protein